MDILTVTTIAQQWSEHFGKSLAQRTPSVGDLFTAWQLCWLLTLTDTPIDQPTLNAFQHALLAAKGLNPLEELQLAWMTQNGLPGVEPSPQRASHSALFLNTLLRLLGRSSDTTIDASFVCAAVQLIAGIPEDSMSELREIVTELETTRPKTQLKIMSPTPSQERVTVEKVAEHLRLNAPDLSATIGLVSLPEPLETPMSWCMKNAKPSVYLGWPADGLEGLHVAEQWALLEHEIFHIRHHLEQKKTIVGSTQSLFSSESAALQHEWQELSQRLRLLPSRTAERVIKQWYEHNAEAQLLRVRDDIQSLAQAIALQKHASETDTADVRGTSTTHERQSIDVRLPLTPLVYALSVRLIFKALNPKQRG